MGKEDIINQNLPLARYEFTRHLHHFLVPLIFKGFTTIYEDSKELCIKIKKENETLKHFQLFLKRIPQWNATILDNETERIKNECPFIMKIVTAIFMSYVKILSSIRIRGKNSNIQIKIPMCDIFIHSVYINSAKNIFLKPQLFKDNIDPFLRVSNAEEINEIIKNAIDETLSSLIPIESILQEYIGNIYEDEGIENEEEENQEEENEEQSLPEEKHEIIEYQDSENENTDDDLDENSDSDSDNEDSDKIISIGNKVPQTEEPFERDENVKINQNENQNEKYEKQENEKQENEKQKQNQNENQNIDDDDDSVDYENSDTDSDSDSEEKQKPDIPLETGPDINERRNREKRKSFLF